MTVAWKLTTTSSNNAVTGSQAGVKAPHGGFVYQGSCARNPYSNRLVSWSLTLCHSIFELCLCDDCMYARVDAAYSLARDRKNLTVFVRMHASGLVLLLPTCLMCLSYKNGFQTRRDLLVLGLHVRAHGVTVCPA